MRSVVPPPPNTDARELLLVCVCICVRGLRISLLKAVHNEEIACRKTHKSLPLCVQKKKITVLSTFEKLYLSKKSRSRQ